MQFDQLRRMAIFAQVVRYGSFSAAARAQDLTTSVISAAVTQLEDELGVRLLHRTTRSLSLTEIGQEFYEKCADMLSTAESAQEIIHEHSGEISGRLRIACASDVATRIVLPALGPLASSHKQLMLDIRVSDQVIDLAEHQIDLAIRSGWLRESAQVARKLANLDEILVASPAYLRAAGVPQTPAELMENHKMISLTRLSDPCQLSLQHRHGTQEKIMMSAFAMTDSVTTMVAMCLDAYAIARVPSFTVADEIQQGSLVRLLPEWSLHGGGIFAVTLKRKLQPPKVQAAIVALTRFLENKVWLPPTQR
ncbi:LysR family transcriptional regulator [Undibacterium rugosum]|uniref:LysR family transcriptional regulator n=1 Tax=Undibacterium rugosum TaxID=2762291 RepID=UPI001B83019E|nr:LysR family transcriptional regulator [Undibacterium rugosum]MBR7778586.1 LysR family transcriptional regulator [Undibacterium rugosum]